MNRPSRCDERGACRVCDYLRSKEIVEHYCLGVNPWGLIYGM